MHNIVNNLLSIQSELKIKINNLNLKNYSPNIIAVSKTFSIKDILPLINHGHIHFGENKVQEAIEKWTTLKNDFKHIQLHMIGKLQTNKVKYVVPLFDYIHSVDNIKLAEKISQEQTKNNKIVKLFIQINIGDEKQKNGILVDQLDLIYKKCTGDLKLNVIGLMCIPPNDNKSSTYFSKIQELVKKFDLKESSMGMSNDYMEAINYRATYLRIGSKIFGERI